MKVCGVSGPASRLRYLSREANQTLVTRANIPLAVTWPSWCGFFSPLPVLEARDNSSLYTKW